MMQSNNSIFIMVIDNIYVEINNLSEFALITACLQI